MLRSVFLVVPTGRAPRSDAPRAEEVERAFAWLAGRVGRNLTRRGRGPYHV